jgi:hypothetical protein
MSTSLKRNTQYVIRITYCVFFLLAGCAPKPSQPTYFIPPAGPKAQPTQVTNLVVPTSTAVVLDLGQTPVAAVTETPELASPTPACTNSLKFIEDVTVPDGTTVSPGQSVDKQWRVQNTGSCDWDSNYHLQRVSGDAMGLPDQIALYPARAGTEAVIELTLTAPQDAGTYHTVWQATDPDGVAFEQPIYVEIVVTSP